MGTSIILSIKHNHNSFACSRFMFGVINQATKKHSTVLWSDCSEIRCSGVHAGRLTSLAVGNEAPESELSSRLFMNQQCIECLLKTSRLKSRRNFIDSTTTMACLAPYFVESCLTRRAVYYSKMSDYPADALDTTNRV